MVLTNTGLNETATQFATLITKGQWGTGTTSPSFADTGLETPVAATLKDLTATVSGSSIQFSHNVPSTSGNGNDLTEFELTFADATNLLRTVGGAITKTSAFQVDTIVGINFVRGS